MIHEFTLVLDREPAETGLRALAWPGWTRSAPRASTQSWRTFSAGAAAQISQNNRAPTRRSARMLGMRLLEPV